MTTLFIVIIFIIVIFTIITGIIIYLNRKKTGSGFDKPYIGNGDIEIDPPGVKISKQFEKSANELSEYINSTVLVLPDTDNPESYRIKDGIKYIYTGILAFVHNDANVTITVVIQSMLGTPVIITYNNMEYYYKPDNPAYKYSGALAVYRKFIDSQKTGLSKAGFLSKSDFEKSTQKKEVYSDSGGGGGGAKPDLIYTAAAKPDPSAATKNYIVKFILYLDGGGNKEDIYNASTSMKIGELINIYTNKYKQYHFRRFLYDGKDLSDSLDRPIGTIIRSGFAINNILIIKTVHINKMNKENEMIEFIKSQTLNNANPISLSKFKLVLTLPSGQSDFIFDWHINNRSKWDWKKIFNKGFGENTEVYKNPDGIDNPEILNSNIFYNKYHIGIFLECLTAAGIVEYNTLENLMKMLSTRFGDADNPKYSRQITLIEVLYGNYMGLGHIAHLLPDTKRDPDVIRAYEQYLEIMTS